MTTTTDILCAPEDWLLRDDAYVRPGDRVYLSLHPGNRIQCDGGDFWRLGPEWTGNCEAIAPVTSRDAMILAVLADRWPGVEFILPAI